MDSSTTARAHGEKLTLDLLGGEQLGRRAMACICVAAMLVLLSGRLQIPIRIRRQSETSFCSFAVPNKGRSYLLRFRLGLRQIYIGTLCAYRLV